MSFPATGWARIAAAFFAAVLAVRCASPVSASQLPARFNIEVSVTPGKPGATTEQVALEWDGAACSIHVHRETAQHARADVDACKAAWNIAARLRDFQPREIDNPQLADFGSRSLVLAWSEEPNQRPVQRRMTWQRELANGIDTHRLFEELGSIARKRIPGVHLYYIP